MREELAAASDTLSRSEGELHPDLQAGACVCACLCVCMYVSVCVLRYAHNSKNDLPSSFMRFPSPPNKL